MLLRDILLDTASAPYPRACPCFASRRPHRLLRGGCSVFRTVCKQVRYPFITVPAEQFRLTSDDSNGSLYLLKCRPPAGRDETPKVRRAR